MGSEGCGQLGATGAVFAADSVCPLNGYKIRGGSPDAHKRFGWFPPARKGHTQ